MPLHYRANAARARAGTTARSRHALALSTRPNAPTAYRICYLCKYNIDADAQTTAAPAL